jgi:uncharacterized PurR-regulated membrane protein YhhQ (DUF165 family)
MIGPLAFVGFLATIPAANWMILNVGNCSPDGPCTVPVGFGLLAPSGVLVIGLALVLRDIVHARWGGGAALLAILNGALVSIAVAPAGLVVASTVALVLSELADLAVYAPLARRRLVLAVFLSGLAGAVVDSALFLWLAFGSLEYLEGQVLGKLWASGAAAAVLLLIRQRQQSWAR